MARDAPVGEILKQLEKTNTGSFLALNNQLSQLQEDDTVEDVFDEGEILTAVAVRQHQSRNLVSRSGDLAVLVRVEDRQPVIVEPRSNSQWWEWSTEEFLPTLALFRRQGGVRMSLDNMEENRGDFTGEKYNLPSVRKNFSQY